MEIMSRYRVVRLLANHNSSEATVLSAKSREPSSTEYIRVSSPEPGHLFPPPSPRTDITTLGKPPKIMIVHVIFYGIMALAGNCPICVSGTIFLSPLRVGDPGSIGRNSQLEYAIPLRGRLRDARESPDSKERSSQMGRSFVKFGRSRDEIIDSASRPAPGRSDVIIGFGRSDINNFQGTHHRKKNFEQLATVCANLLTTSTDGLTLYLTKLHRLCNSLLGLGNNDNDDDNETGRKSSVIQLLDDAFQPESPWNTSEE